MSSSSPQQRPTSNASIPSLPEDAAAQFRSAVTLYPYAANDATKLSFKPNETIYIVTQHSSGWWHGFLFDPQTGKPRMGWFPASYVRELEEDTSRSVRSEESPRPMRSPRDDSQQMLVKELTSRLGAAKGDRHTMPATRTESDDSVGASPNSRRTARGPADQGRPSNEEPLAPRIPHRGPALAPRRSIHDISASIQPQAADPLANILPANWRQKMTADGRVYYYNVQTNQTVWTLDDTQRTESPLAANSETSLSTSSQNNAGQTDNQDQSGQLEAQQDQKLTWDLLIRNIVAAISELNQLAKRGEKKLYVPQSRSLITTIKEMLMASDTLDADSPLIQSDKTLRSHHYQLLVVISHLVLSVKKASVVWPEPDAVDKMRYQAGQVLLAVRHYVTYAMELHLPLNVDFQTMEKTMTRANTNQMLPSQQHTQRPMSVMSAQTNGGAIPASASFNSRFVPDSRTISDAEIISELDFFSNEIKVSIDKMLEQRNGGGHVSMQFFVDYANRIAELVGALLSFLEEVQIDSMISKIGGISKDSAMAQALNDYRITRVAVHNNISGLITSVAMASDPFAPQNALKPVMLNTTVVLKSVKELIVTTKTLIEQKEMREQTLLEQEVAEQLREAHDGISPQEPPTPARRFSESRVKPPIIPERQTTRPASTMPAADERPKIAPRPAIPPAPVRKQRKFFGETVSTERSFVDIMDRPSNWYMLPSYSPDDLVLNAEAADKVKAGTLEALIDRLTSHDNFDADFTTAFLFTFRLFAKPNKFVACLMERFLIAEPEGLTDVQMTEWKDRKKRPIQLRVYKTFKKWLEEFWYHNEDESALDDIVHFARYQLVLSFPKEADRLIELGNRRKSRNEGLRLSGLGGTAITAEKQPPPAILPKNLKKMVLLDVDALEMARQLTLLEQSFFCKIDPLECLYYRGDIKIKDGQPPPEGQNIREMINQSNKITGWVAESILLEKDLKRRGQLLKQFIKIADHCHAMNNFATRESILAALNSTPIYRLKKTWEQISGKTSTLFESLGQFMDRENNFVTYRQTLKITEPPCIPFLGLYLTDITFIKQGNPDNLSNNRLINFDKFGKMAAIVEEVQRFQEQKYILSPIGEIHDLLASQMASSRDVEELHELSASLEPREQMWVGDKDDAVI